MPAGINLRGLVCIAGVSLWVLIAPRVRAAAARFEPYTLETAGGDRIAAELARLEVPERHGRPEGKKVELVFIRLKSTAQHPGPPIVYLAGGPGGSGIALVRGPRSPVILALREVADVIALDQRGTGLAKPSLNCQEPLDYPLDQLGEPDALARHYEKALTVCEARLRADGVDLGAYNTEESADDVESLREAIGAAKISLFGSSYGTHLGLAVLRRHEARIHRAVFSGVEGPNQTLKLPANIQRELVLVGQLAAADDQARRYAPNLLNLVESVLKKLERTPAKIPVPFHQNEVRTVTIGKFDVQQATAGWLGTREGKSRIPALFYGLWQEDYSSPEVQSMAREIIEGRIGPLGTAMAYAMDCASGSSPERRRMIQQQAQDCLLGGDIDFPIPQICAGCGLVELPGSFRAPLVCNIPTLFLSGSYDGRTPPSNAEEVRRGFSNSHHVIIEGAGHGNELFISSPLIQETIVEFMKTGRVTMQTIHLPALHFRAVEATERKQGP